jgi:hypothetical protein
MRECEILYTGNGYVDEINARMIHRFLGEASTVLIWWMMMNVTIILKIFSIPSHLMICRRTSSESRSIVPYSPL